MVQRLPFDVQQFCQFLAATIGLGQAFAQTSLRALDGALLLRQLFATLLHGFLAALQLPLLIIQLVADDLQFLLKPCLLAKRPFFNFEFRLAPPIADFDLSALDNRLRFGFGFFSPQPIQELHRHGAQDRGKWNQNVGYVVRGRHDRTP